MFSLKNIKRFAKWLLVFLGIIFLILILLGFTERPFWAYYALSSPQERLTTPPEKIVLMGADGMPSKKNLIRCYFAIEAAKTYPETRIIIALPQPDTTTSDDNLLKMSNEFTAKGIDSTRILFETTGVNTYSQVKNMCEILNPDEPVLVITSPEHMKRTLLCFKKQGFINVSGQASFGNDINPELLKQAEGDYVSGSLALRYNIWTQFQYEIIVAREYMALLYYKYKGWI